MSDTADVVICPAVFEQLQTGAPVKVDLIWHPRDPLAVAATFRGPDGKPVTWVWSRELLAQGLCEPAGIGDVRISPHGQHDVLIELRGPRAHACFTTSRAVLSEFLNRSYREVAAGAEETLSPRMWDVMLADLLHRDDW